MAIAVGIAEAARVQNAATDRHVAGDLNATVDNVPMRRLADLGYLDAATVVGGHGANVAG
jgi:hypothetical protein